MFRHFNQSLVCLLIAAIFTITPLTTARCACGDSNGDAVTNIADLVYLMNYCFKNGPPPPYPDTAEADGYEFLNIRDAVYLCNFIFHGGPWAVCPATNPEYQSTLEPLDTLKIPPATLSARDSMISVPIWYKNSEPVRGISLQLKVNVGQQVPHIDSLVLGGRMSGVNKWITLDNVAGTVNSGFLWTSSADSLPPGSGTLFTLYLSIDPEPTDRRVFIDTLRLAPSNSPVFIEPNMSGDLPFFIGLRPDSLPFAPASNYSAGLGPASVFCADVDGDGDLDLIIANSSTNSISIMKNNGNGTFGSPLSYDAGNGPKSVFSGDLDGDGDLDLAVANYSSNNVYILTNDGNGSFNVTPLIYSVGTHPYSVFCADLDGDDDLDIAVANEQDANVSVLKNNGNGTFQSAVNYDVGSGPRSVFCADLDGDGDLDLAVANYGTDNVSILKNNGNGTFEGAVNYAAGDGAGSVFCADLDGDGDLDLAVANSFNSSVSILKNNGDGTFQSDIKYGAGSGPGSVFCADLDGDGDLDLAVANWYSANVSILKNNGNGTFKEAVNYGVGDVPTSVFGADLDGDGDFDLAVTNQNSNNVSILKNLTQIPANQPPHPFSLLSPFGNEYAQDTTFKVVHFDWQAPMDPNLGDQITYNMFLSTKPDFAPPNTQVYPGLLISRLTDEIPIGQYYWKVEAFDNWGASRWSNQTYRFFNDNYLHDTLLCVAFSPVDFIMTDPKGDSIGIGFSTIPGATFDTTSDYDHDGHNDYIATLPNRLVGDYTIRVFPEPDAKVTYSLGIRIDGGALNMLTNFSRCPEPEVVDTYHYFAVWYLTGDATADWKVDAGDVVYLINYLFRGGPAPNPPQRADVTCNGIVDSGDIVFLINFLFRAGPAPSCP
ncbi:MAG: FG-GAP-like repeat-containing protein [Candidatus Zixiibacteriota bacterium]